MYLTKQSSSCMMVSLHPYQKHDQVAVTSDALLNLAHSSSPNKFLKEWGNLGPLEWIGPYLNILHFFFPYKS